MNSRLWLDLQAVTGIRVDRSGSNTEQQKATEQTTLFFIVRQQKSNAARLANVISVETLEEFIKSSGRHGCPREAQRSKTRRKLLFRYATLLIVEVETATR